MKNASSIKDRLANYSKKNDKLFSDVLNVYVLERVLFRISKSNFADNFTLKGGILLYGLYENSFTRATTDIDLLAKNISNSKSKLKDVFSQILSIKTDDPIKFDIDNLEVNDIKKSSEYHGARISTTAYLDRTRVHVSIDIGFGDVVYPNRVTMNYPTILNEESPIMFAYSTYSIISEKIEAIVALGLINSRYKDFYDICLICENEDFDGMVLRESLIETFSNRNTSFGEIVAFNEDFVKDSECCVRWKGFIKRKRVEDTRSFSDVVSEIQAFLLPVINSIRKDEEFNMTWKHKDMKWM
ncbi:MAG: nucleotidyl transferase AbiEii/AbiGii toxin family protein [Lactobacillus iners]|nr:nucleotidyl transferase AbiEii/AbiGii toxin family protein [Lactobacillus iners]